MLLFRCLTQARVLYNRAAGHAVNTDFETDVPGHWQKIHGCVLGMRAAIEGAALSAATNCCCCLHQIDKVPLYTPMLGGVANANNQVILRERGDCTMLSAFAADVVRASQDWTRNKGSGVNLSVHLEESTQRNEENGKLKHMEDEIRNQGFATGSKQGVDNAGESAPEDFSLETAAWKRRTSENEQKRVSEESIIHQGETSIDSPQPLSLLPPSPPPQLSAVRHNATQRLFGCLANKQVTVRDAAAATVEALASVLGPTTTLVLYEWTISELEGIGSLSVKRQLRDKMSGLLNVLDRLVRLIPRGTIGETWDRLLATLR